MLREKPDGFWKDGICMFLDGASFVHKTNPFQTGRNHKSTGYRLKNEGLKVTSRGRKEGVNGKSVTYYVGISYEKGVVMCSELVDHCNGRNYAKFSEKELPPVFTKVGKGKCIVQDGCPVMNSGIVKSVYERLGAEVFSIPARSPDLNPVENVFNNVRRELRQQAMEMQIRRETFDQFKIRVKNTLMLFCRQTIDRTIESMVKRLHQIIESGGYRTKY